LTRDFYCNSTLYWW